MRVFRACTGHPEPLVGAVINSTTMQEPWYRPGESESTKITASIFTSESGRQAVLGKDRLVLTRAVYLAVRYEAPPRTGDSVCC